MTILSKKKEYWIQPKDTSIVKGKRKIPAQSNSVVFLGSKPTRAFDCKSENSAEECVATNPFLTVKNQDLWKRSGEPKLIAMSTQCPNDALFEAEQTSLPNSTCPETTVSQSCSVISVPPLSTSHFPKPHILSPTSVHIPNVIIHRESPALFHQSFYSGNFDQHSLYSCDSHMTSELDLKACSLTWSNYNMRRPSSTSDCYNDLFQKASFCKKRKNRMRSDIAAAIALNRSQSFQLNKDTESLVGNEMEIISDERTTL